MVRLTRIYTRGGDRGRTSLGDGRRVAKTHPRIAATGCVDELNAVLGMIVAQRRLARNDRALLRGIQNDLFDLGADLCVPLPAREPAGKRLRVSADQVRALESALDARNRDLEPLSSFVLPGGRPLAAQLHLARVVCRRCEIAVATVLRSEPKRVGPHVLPYINRLSDLLFVMARAANDGGRADVLWRPGAGQPATGATNVVKRNPGQRRRSGRRG